MSELPNQPSDSFKRLNPHLYPACPRLPAGIGDQPSAINNQQSTIPRPHADFRIQKTTDEKNLNKLERDWLAYLRRLHPAEHIGIQNITLKLGHDCRYTPDFWTIDANGQFFFWETKGYRVRLGQAKIIIAARTFRWARFVLVERKKGEWIQTPINP